MGLECNCCVVDRLFYQVILRPRIGRRLWIGFHSFGFNTIGFLLFVC
ncbi:hypothetical protein V6Z11_A05G442600 [Gossypium hirsutum]